MPWSMPSFHLENHFFPTQPSLLLLILFQGPSQMWPLLGGSLGPPEAVILGSHCTLVTAVGLLPDGGILEGGDFGCPAPCAEPNTRSWTVPEIHTPGLPAFYWVPGAVCIRGLGKPQLAPFPVLHIRADLLCPRLFLSGELLI